MLLYNSFLKMNEIDKGFFLLEIAYKENGLTFPTGFRVTQDFIYMWN